MRWRRRRLRTQRKQRAKATFEQSLVVALLGTLESLFTEEQLATIDGALVDGHGALVDGHHRFAAAKDIDRPEDT